MLTEAEWSEMAENPPHQQYFCSAKIEPELLHVWILKYNDMEKNQQNVLPYSACELIMQQNKSVCVVLAWE